MKPNKKLPAALLAVLCFLSPISLSAEEELVKFGNFESWITRLLAVRHRHFMK